MTWQKILFRPSFRGVRFHVESATDQSEILTAEHFVFGGENFIEEVGRKKTTHKTEGFLAGPNLHASRGVLEKALLKKTVGVLVHPSLGPIPAKCLEFSSKESTETMGKCSFNAVFVREDLLGVEFFDTALGLVSQAKNLLDEACLALSEILALAEIPGQVMASLAQVMDQVKIYLTTDEGIRRFPELARELKDSTLDLKKSFEKILREPKEMARLLSEALPLGDLPTFPSLEVQYLVLSAICSARDLTTKEAEKLAHSLRKSVTENQGSALIYRVLPLIDSLEKMQTNKKDSPSGNLLLLAKKQGRDPQNLWESLGESINPFEVSSD